MISILQWISVLVIEIILNIILFTFNLESISIIITIVLNFIIFNKLLQKFYQTSFKKNISIYTVFTSITIMIIIVLRSFVIMPFYVRGTAMNPNYTEGSYLLINKLNKNYQRGEVVIFKNPQKENFLIKRIVALPNEKVQIKENAVYLYNPKISDFHQLVESYLPENTQTISLNENIVELQSDEYFLLGDNRKRSQDSRSFGAINKSNIVGKVFIKINGK